MVQLYNLCPPTLCLQRIRSADERTLCVGKISFCSSHLKTNFLFVASFDSANCNLRIASYTRWDTICILDGVHQDCSNRRWWFFVVACLISNGRRSLGLGNFLSKKCKDKKRAYFLVFHLISVRMSSEGTKFTHTHTHIA